MDKIELFKKGCLGTCWYGKYHYLEPWIGCEHNCLYCYAKYRIIIKKELIKRKISFNNPETLFDRKKLIEKIKKTAFSGKIKILKLSRFTDIFTPKYVSNGLSFEILEILALSPIERIIITTKGIPSNEIINIMKKKYQ